MLREPSAFTRRQFLYQGLTLASASLAVPRFIQASALMIPRAALGMSAIPGVDQDRILVVVQLSGGNDGLNTIVPYGADEYFRLRPTIGIPTDLALKLGRSHAVGLHPQMGGIKALYDDGLCGIAMKESEPWIVEDATVDPRTADNPWVTGEFGMRFYASVALRSPDGFALGTFSVLGFEPRRVTDAEVATLSDLAALGIDELELRLEAERLRGELHGSHEVRTLPPAPLESPPLSEAD